MLDISWVPLQIPAAPPLPPATKKAARSPWALISFTHKQPSGVLLRPESHPLTSCPVASLMSHHDMESHVYVSKFRGIHTLGPFLTRGTWELIDFSFLYHPWTFWNTFHMDPFHRVKPYCPGHGQLHHTSLIWLSFLLCCSVPVPWDHIPW